MQFCTAINCMDGRTQLPVIHFMLDRFNAEYVDSVTEPGPNGILADGGDAQLVESILHRVGISVHKHGSRAVAIVGHYDCAGNPAAKPVQLEQLQTAAAVLASRFSECEILQLWVDEQWQVHEISADS